MAKLGSRAPNLKKPCESSSAASGVAQTSQTTNSWQTLNSVPGANNGR